MSIFSNFFAERGHLQHRATARHTALLASGIAVDFIVQHDGGELFLAEPRVQRARKSNVSHTAVADHDHDVFRLIAKSQPQSTGQSACDTILIPVVAIDERDGGLRNSQAPAAGGSDCDRVFWIREGDDRQPDKQRHGATGAHGVLFKNFLECPHLGDGRFLAEWAVFDHISILFRHKLLEPI